MVTSESPSLWGILAFLLLVGLVLSWVLKPVACAPLDADVVRAVERQGWSEVRLGERHPYFVGFHGCAGSDSFAYEAWAVNPVGRHVVITVCSGNTVTQKGVTVRTR
jgi:hypothetical protein